MSHRDSRKHFEAVREILETPIATSIPPETFKARVWQQLLEAERDDDTSKLITVIAQWCQRFGTRQRAADIRSTLGKYGP